MTDSQQFLLVLVLIYLSECLGWLSLHCVAFVSWGGESWSWTRPGRWFGNRIAGLLPKPFLPTGLSIVCPLWPLSVSPQGAVSNVSTAFDLPFRPEQPWDYLAFGDMQSVVAVEKDVQVNGKSFCRAGTASLAEHLARTLRTCRDAAPAERAEKIDAALAAAFDTAAIRARLDELRWQLPMASFCSVGLAAWVFFVGPLVVWLFGWHPAWIVLLLGLLADGLLAAGAFAAAHRALYPEPQFPGATSRRRTAVAVMLLNPLAAMRGRDLLSRDLLATFHPLAAAQVLCDEPAFRDLARRVLIDLRHPLLPLCHNPAPSAIETEAWFRDRQLGAVERFLRSAGIDLEELVRAEAPAGPDCRTYCPRCRSQFILESGQCEACGGLTLVALGSEATSCQNPLR